MPDLAVLAQVLPALAEADDVARARQLDLVDQLDPTRSPRHDHDAVGERDGLGEVVGDEDHRLLPRAPQ